MEMENSTFVLTTLIRNLGIPISASGVINEMEKHPAFDSMLALSEVLDFYKVPNAAYYLNADQLIDVPVPFIAHLNSGRFGVVTDYNNHYVTLSDDKAVNKVMSISDFDKLYNGAVLVAEKNEISGELGYVKTRRKEKVEIFRQPVALGGMAILLAILIMQHSGFARGLNVSLVLLALFKLLGLGTSILLLVQSIDANNTLIQKLCSSDNNKDCNGILSSKAAKVNQYISWSEVGFFYFAGTSIQGLCFPEPAFELYYRLNKDKTYLHQLYGSLEAFDHYLWKYRDSDGDGCLEAWCVYDTGEDNNILLQQAPNAWGFDHAPNIQNIEEAEMIGTHFQEDTIKDVLSVPIESMDVMSYSYTCRHTLALISAELHNGKSAFWENRSLDIRRKIKSYLWDESKKACYNRDANNQVIPALTHNNLRCMYYGSFDQKMADDFIGYHLQNNKEFWTAMPLPSIAVNDPAFRNIVRNNWSGQPEGLTYQRAIRAFENYGHYAELTTIGTRFLNCISRNLIFSQQYDPFNGQPNSTKNGYGPSLLAALEYISRLNGVNLNKERIEWSGINKAGAHSTYEQRWGDHRYRLEYNDGQMKGLIDGQQVFSCVGNARIVTDLNGKFLSVVGIDTIVQSVELLLGKKRLQLELAPNHVYNIKKDSILQLAKAIDYHHVPLPDLPPLSGTFSNKH